jgi:hypothetical protein
VDARPMTKNAAESSSLTSNGPRRAADTQPDHQGARAHRDRPGRETASVPQQPIHRGHRTRPRVATTITPTQPCTGSMTMAGVRSTPRHRSMAAKAVLSADLSTAPRCAPRDGGSVLPPELHRSHRHRRLRAATCWTERTGRRRQRLASQRLSPERHLVRLGQPRGFQRTYFHDGRDPIVVASYSG